MDKTNTATEKSRTTQGRGPWLSMNSAGFYMVARQLHLIGRMDRKNGGSRWLRGLRRGSAAARLLGLRVRMQPGAQMFVSCECLLSGRDPCEGPIPRAQESYRVCVTECDLRNNNTIHLEWVGRKRSN